MGCLSTFADNQIPADVQSHLAAHIDSILNVKNKTREKKKWKIKKQILEYSIYKYISTGT